jgi:hypothetical protein
MPIEIRELVIRAQVDPCGNGSNLESDAPDMTNGHGRDSAGSHSQEAIIRTCIQEVLRVLEAKQER